MSTDPIKPKVDDQYWFTFSEQLVGKSVPTLDENAGRIQSLVIWLWGIYTASAAVGFVLASQKLPPIASGLIALPSVLLILVYWGSVWVQSCVSVSFDPRSPTEIRRAYARVVEVKRKRLNITLLFAFLAATSVGTALVAASMTKPLSSGSPTLDASLREDGDRKFLAVLCSGVSSQQLHLRISEFYQARPVLIHEGIYRVTPSGFLQVSVQVSSGGPFAVVTDFEGSNGQRTSLSRSVDRGPMVRK